MTQAASKRMTAEQLLQRSEELGRCELLRGELIEMTPAGNAHGIIALRIGRRIGAYVDEHRLGVAYAAETGFVLERNPDTVRAPDVAFLSNSRGVDASADGFVEGAPDFAVEVVSPSDTASYVAAKVEAWLHHGTQLVWVADPHTQTITAYTPDHHATIYHVGDTLPGDPVLPGLALPLSEIFNG
jgi:Uma2 family endonuclease